MKLSTLNAKLSTLIALLWVMGIAQSRAVGEWKVFQKYANTTEHVAAFHNQIFVHGDGTVWRYDIATGDTIGLSRLTGLTGADIQLMDAVPSSNRLCLVYSDGNIDMLDSALRVHNIPDYRNKAIVGDKTVNSAVVVGKYIYVSTANGFFTVDTEQDVIARSFSFSTPTLYAWIHGSYYYRATSEGIWRCPADQTSAYNQSNWTRVSTELVTDLAAFSYKGEEAVWLVTVNHRLLQTLADGTLSSVTDETFYTGICVSSHYLYVRGSGTRVMDINTGVWTVNWSAPYNQATEIAFTSASDSVMYMLIPTQGLLAARVTEFAEGRPLGLELLWQDLQKEEVGSGNIARLVWKHGRLYGIGSSNSQTHQDWSSGVICIWDGESWTNIHESRITAQTGVPFRGLEAIAVTDNPDRYYVSTFRTGIYLIEGDSVVEHWTHDNSPIRYTIPNYVCDWVSALWLDDDGWLWAANSLADTALLAMSPQGTWKQYPIRGFNNRHSIDRILQATVDSYRLKWILSTTIYQECQCAIYYDGGTPGDLSDDSYAVFSTLTDQDGNTLYPYFFNDIVEDRKGAVWLLTSSGPFVIDSQIDGFNNPGSVRRPKIPRNDGTNLADYLMAGVNTTCMAVDAANRKWIGTSGNGVYLLSEDGLSQLEHFTTENSPLASDAVLALAYDEDSGTLFISTDGGVCSYVSDAVAGAEDYSHAWCYPNPVRPDFTGKIHIMGLMDNSQVRITDIRNHVIFATQSSGGMVTWDGCGPSGSRVPAGVYFVYGIDADGKEGCVTKLLVIE